MFRFVQTLVSFLQPAVAPIQGGAHPVPCNLLERAEARASRDPQGAAELRRAALAYLGVVR